MATAGFTALVGATSAVNYWLQGRPKLGTAVAIATLFVLILTIAKNAVTLRQESNKQSMQELEGCLMTLHAALDPGAGMMSGHLRLAIHRAAGEMLEQVTEYIGDTPKPGRIGRLFPGNAGIIGKAYRENEYFLGQRKSDDYDDYVNELVTDWNYTRERARSLNPAVQAWMAVPFADPDTNRVDAVLYLDSKDRDFFTAERLELIVGAATGIAVFIGRRYTA